MKSTAFFILSVLSMVTAYGVRGDTLKSEPLEAYKDRIEWFAQSQYGMFIHFGLYSHLGGEWKGEPVEWYAEWIQASRDIPREEYAKIINVFNPAAFDADFIASTAKQAGMKYLVITSKHHEGFCLWDSQYTDFDIANSALKGRDLLAELSEACKQHGIKFGLYYSIIDWNHSSQEPSMKGDRPFPRWGQTLMKAGQKAGYVDYQRRQIIELIRNYQPDLLWFDGDWVDWWSLDDGIRLYHTIRKEDPAIVVNNRVAKRDQFQLDFVTQEQEHFEEAFPRHWEGCYTMNKSWGYKKHDDQWKDAQTVYNKLKDINEKGGNLLLNVGPDGDGRIQPEAVEILLKTAALLQAKPIEKRQPKIQTVPSIFE